MSKAKLSQIKIPPEARKFPFDQTFLCPKCSEILFVKIHYIDATMIPQVKYKCPKRHSGTVDLLLFFSLFHSSNKEIEEDLSKFDEKLEKDIELFKTKKMKDRKKILDPINFAKIINKKNKEKEKEKEKEEEQNKEKNNIEETENKNKEEIKQEIKQEKEKEEENKKLFVQIQKCNEIKFSLFNIKKEKELKIIEKLEKQHPKSESRTAEKVEDNSPDEKNNPKKINKSNKISLSPKSKVNNINIIKKETSKEKEKEKEDSKEKKEEKKEEIKIKEKETKETKEDKFTCSLHGNRFTGYCFSCKKDMCKKCFKKRGHKKRKIFSNVLLNEKNLNELNKSLNLCQESLNKFENKAHSLMDELGNKERNEKIILNIMSKAFIDINRENLKEIREVIKTYVNCVKKNMLNYEIIMNVKNLNIKNVIIVPKDISELIKVLKNYKNYIIQKNINKKSVEDDNKDKENKYLQLFNAFFDLLKNYENKEINFKEIVEDENFRKLINSNDYGNIDLNKEESNKISIEEEKELNDLENNMDEYDMNYDYDDNYEDCFEEEEENENEIEYEDDYEEEYNDEDLEEDCMFAINENKKNEQNEENENEDTK